MSAVRGDFLGSLGTCQDFNGHLGPGIGDGHRPWPGTTWNVQGFPGTDGTAHINEPQGDIPGSV